MQELQHELAMEALQGSDDLPTHSSNEEDPEPSNPWMAVKQLPSPLN